MTLRVTPRLFSGRVNPTWTLDDAAAVDVLRELHLRSRRRRRRGSSAVRLGFSGLQIDVGSDLLAAETACLPPSSSAQDAPLTKAERRKLRRGW
jgi:hypothetical protein